MQLTTFNSKNFYNLILIKALVSQAYGISSGYHSNPYTNKQENSHWKHRFTILTTEETFITIKKWTKYFIMLLSSKLFFKTFSIVFIIKIFYFEFRWSKSLVSILFELQIIAQFLLYMWIFDQLHNLVIKNSEFKKNRTSSFPCNVIKIYIYYLSSNNYASFIELL